MEAIYSFIAAWIAGGIVLATQLLLPTDSRPFALSFALLGFGSAGLGARALGYGAVPDALAIASLACALLGALGYALQRVR